MSKSRWLRGLAPVVAASVLSVSFATGAIAAPGGQVAVQAAVVQPTADGGGTASVGYAPVLINEVSAASWNGAKDEDGDAKDWVELYNPGAYTVDISNWGLSNKDASPFRWVFPQGTTIDGGKYLVVWLSKKDRAVAGKQLHASFNLDNGADSLYLSVPNGTALGQLADSATPPVEKPDQTWCRMPSGSKSSPFQVCAKQTPGAVNSGDANPSLADSPSISPRGGLYAGAQTVTITGPAGATIRYTLDGSEPTATSTVYTAPITVSKSLSVRASAFASGKAPSLTATQSYVIDAGASKYAGQRVIMVTMTPSELSSYKAKSKTATFAPAIDMRETDGSVIYAGGVSASVAGRRGSLIDQGNVPLNLSFKDSTGAKSFTYPLFPRKGEQDIEKIRLRNSGSDWWYAHLRDGIGGVAMQGSGTAWSDVAPVQMFLNGTYYGVMDMREKEDETLVASTTGTSKDAVQYWNDTEASAGGKQAETDYKDMVAWFKKTDLSKAANYEQAKKLVDVDSLVEVMAAFDWSAVWDWPWRNVQVYRSAATDNVWHWKVHDWDITQDSAGHDWGGYTKADYNMYSRLTSSGNDVFTALLKNPDFKNLFVNAVADALNERFSSTTAAARVDMLAGEYKPYMPAFRTAFPSLGTAAKWESTDVARLRAFATNRAGYLDSTTKTSFKLTARQPLTVSVNDASMGTVQLNTMDLSTYWKADNPTWTGSYYPEAPVVLTAKAKVGYRFVGWEGASTSTDARISMPIKAAASVRAVFAKLDGKVAAPAFGAQSDITTTTGTTVRVLATATDPQGYPLTYSAKKLPKGVDIDPATGTIWGTVTTPGTYATKVTATNGSKSTDLSFTWTVTDRDGSGVNSSPLTGAVQTEWWKNATLTGDPEATNLSPLDLAVPSGQKPFTAAGSDNWSTRWSTSLTAATTGTYTLRFAVGPYDGIKAYVAGGLVVDQWAGDQSKAQTFDVQVDLKAGEKTPLVIEFWDKSGAAAMHLTWQTPGSTGFTPVPAGNLTVGPVIPAATGTEPAMGPVTAEYWKAATISGTPVATRTYEPGIGLTLASGVAPVAQVAATNYSVRWTTEFRPSVDGAYTFRAVTSTRDGVRVYVDDKLIIDSWANAAAAKTLNGSVDLTAGKKVALRVEYVNYSADSLLALTVAYPGANGLHALPTPTLAGAAQATPPTVGKITTEYFANLTLTGTAKVTKTDDTSIALSVAAGAAPFSGVGTAFSTRWTTTLTPATTGTYSLRVTNGIRDGVRVYVGDKLVLDQWAGANTVSQTWDVNFDLTAGQPVPLRVEHTDPSGEAKLSLAMVWPGSASFQALPAAA